MCEKQDKQGEDVNVTIPSQILPSVNCAGYSEV